jgi:hypothetical protein
MTTSLALVADLHRLEVGWLCWRCPIIEADVHQVGGVISAIYTRDLFDQETGEIGVVRFYRCLNYFRHVDEGNFAQTLTGSEISLPEGVAPPDRALIRRTIRRIWEYNYKTKGDFTRTVIDLHDEATRLLAVIR